MGQVLRRFRLTPTSEDVARLVAADALQEEGYELAAEVLRMAPEDLLLSGRFDGDGSGFGDGDGSGSGGSGGFGDGSGSGSGFGDGDGSGSGFGSGFGFGDGSGSG